MLNVFFDWEGVVHQKYAPPGQTINKEYYLNVLCLLRDAIQWKWLQLWATGDWQLHHNNAPTHTSCLMQSCLVKHEITQVTQHPYSPDLVPCDFWLLPKLKSPLKGKRFQTIDEIQENMMEQLQRILQNVLNNGRDSGRTVWGSKVPTLKETEASLSYLQSFLYL